MADYSTVLQIETDHVEATFHRGTVYEKLGKLDEAIEDFSKVLSLEPDHVKASYARGTCRNLKGDFAPAIGEKCCDAFMQCIVAGPDCTDCHNGHWLKVTVAARSIFSAMFCLH